MIKVTWSRTNFDWKKKTDKVLQLFTSLLYSSSQNHLRNSQVSEVPETYQSHNISLFPRL